MELEGVEGTETEQIKKKLAMKKSERERGGRGGEEGVPLCLAMAFSCGVPVVVEWEFPSVRDKRKTTEDVFSWLTRNARASRSFLFSCVFTEVYMSVFVCVNDVNSRPSLSL